MSGQSQRKINQDVFIFTNQCFDEIEENYCPTFQLMIDNFSKQDAPAKFVCSNTITADVMKNYNDNYESVTLVTSEQPTDYEERGNYLDAVAMGIEIVTSKDMSVTLKNVMNNNNVWAYGMHV